MQHVDESAALEMEGYKVSFIQAGEYKTEGNSLGPLPDDARAFLQSQVDAYYSAFTGAISKGRGVPISQVRDGMGKGRCLMASDALAAGMLDGICSFDDVVSRMQKAIKSGNSGARADLVTPTIEAEPPVIPQPAAEHRAAIFRRTLQIT